MAARRMLAGSSGSSSLQMVVSMGTNDVNATFSSSSGAGSGSNSSASLDADVDISAHIAELAQSMQALLSSHHGANNPAAMMGSWMHSSMPRRHDEL